MTTIILTAIFLVVSLIALAFSPSEYHATTLIFSMVSGLTAVIITGLTMIIKRLDVLCGEKAARDCAKKEAKDE